MLVYPDLPLIIAAVLLFFALGFVALLFRPNSSPLYRPQPLSVVQAELIGTAAIGLAFTGLVLFTGGRDGLWSIADYWILASAGGAAAAWRLLEKKPKESEPTNEERQELLNLREEVSQLRELVRADTAAKEKAHHDWIEANKTVRTG